MAGEAGRSSTRRQSSLGSIDLSGRAADINASLIAKGYAAQADGDRLEIVYRYDRIFWMHLSLCVLFSVVCAALAVVLWRVTGAPLGWLIAFLAVGTFTLLIVVPIQCVMRHSLVARSPVLVLKKSDGRILVENDVVADPGDRFAMVTGTGNDAGLNRDHQFVTALCVVSESQSGVDSHIRVLISTIGQDVRWRRFADEFGAWLGTPIARVRLPKERMPMTGDLDVLRGLMN